MLRLKARIQCGQSSSLTEGGILPVVAQLLAARGVETPAQAQAFLHPSLDQLHDPFLLSGMQDAVRTIEEAMAAQQRIVIYGDYDVDGVCGVSILYEYLKERGASVTFYIPARHGEGYGLNMDAVEQLSHEADLLITVDCGITNAQEIAKVYELGMRAIVTDHHEPPAVLPACEAVIDPLLGDYPFRRLCGAGVAIKLVTALGGLSAALPMLDLAALATVADLVPLLDENRAIVHCGLEAIRRTVRPGLKALIEVAGLQDKVLTAGHLGYQLGPRINAGGRLAHAGRNVTLLTTQDQEEADEIATALQAENARRQQLEGSILDKADAWVQTNADFLSDRALVVAGVDWNAGVVGLVASRLVEKYRWPVVLLSQQGDVCVGSARSIPGVNIYEAMATCQDLFTRFGGHSQAAGLTLPTANLSAFRKRLNEAIRNQAAPDAFIPTDMYDLELALSDVTVSLVEQLEQLAPTGFGNPAPTFCLRDAQVLSRRCVGREQAHLQLQLAQQGVAVGGIAFRQGALCDTLPDRVDALFTANINEWNGRRMPQCEVQRLLPHAPLAAFREACRKDGERFAAAGYARIRAGQRPPQAVAPQVQAFGDMCALRAAVQALLTDSCQGALLVSYTQAGALAWLEWLEAQGLADRLDYAFGTPADMRGFHTFCAWPDLVALKAPYAQIVFLEGVPPAEEALLARASCPKAMLLAADDVASRAWMLAEVASWAPSDDALRGLYRAVRSGQGWFQGVSAVATASGLSETAALAGIEVLAELQLVSFTKTPFRLALLPPKKCDLAQSRLLRGIRAWAAGMEGEEA